MPRFIRVTLTGGSAAAFTRFVVKSDDELKDRILDVAMELASEGGFENVRQRDVASGANIALGTLYKRFRSKEDILSALLEREAIVLEARLAKKPATGKTELDRLTSYYATVTRALCRKPQLAKAMLRATTSGDPNSSDNVVKYQGRMINLVVNAIQGADRGSPTPREFEVALLLQHVWFAALVGWAAGLQTQKRVIEITSRAATIILAGIDA